MKRRQRGSFYRKSLIWLLLITSIPGFITAGCIYWFSVSQIENDLSALHQSQIEERVKNVDDQLMYLELSLSHWAFSPRYGADLQELDFVYHFQDTRDVTKSLVVLHGSNPLIQDVSLYIERNEPVLFKPEHYKVDDPSILSEYRKLLDDNRSIYWTDRVSEAEGDNGQRPSGLHDPVTIVHKIPGGSASPFGVLTVTLDRERFVNVLRTLTPYNEGATFLMEDSGNILLSDNSAGNDVDVLLRQEVMNREQPSGTFMWQQGDKTYSVSYGQLKRVDKLWTYVSAAPMTAITSPVMALSNIILIVSLAGLLLALMLSWLASIRMYSPIARLIRRFSGDSDFQHEGRMDEFQYIENQWNVAASESLNLQAKLNDQLPGLRTGFLLQLLQGHLHAYSEEDLRERMKRYGWNVENHCFHVLHIRLTGDRILNERYAHGDQSLVTFAASNIMEELAAHRFEQFSVMNFHDLSVGLFIMSPADMPLSECLNAYGEEITSAINRILKLQVTITISRQTDTVRRMAETFMEVERAAGFRQFVNQNQILNMEELSAVEANHETNYPFALELDIIQSMRSGKLATAEDLIAQFLKVIQSYHGTEIQVQQSMLQLLGSIQHMMLQSGVNPFRLFRGANLFERLSDIRDPDKMQHWMKEQVVVPFIQERESRANLQSKQMIEQTVGYIQANYMKDLSLESCADLAGTNSYTLSKLFKQNTGVNFIDYVTELRLVKAKELLRGTDWKINDIAEAVGYQQRYFNRIFKKQTGITPTEYRDFTPDYKKDDIRQKSTTAVRKP
ncbi:AraC family transcriptional regulator [Paenibacillus abyssi]|uniref:HTH-type transcriptional regulator YesS n=1 Tax=Paenibacillus abyssi TaxID=1340531 RepID=A0A917CS82_9BACL|nr:AraC family transcriptional regulator [Paenibacillus abyssi]GGF95231.1 HTH-type transcriptional regulator YesS [Paenibacillus abyssi]